MKTKRIGNCALLIASVASMIQQFNMRNIAILQELGYQVEVACNFETGSTCPKTQIDELKQELKRRNVKWYHIDFARNVFRFGENRKAYSQLENLVRKGNYSLIHCQSPIGGALGRMAGHKYHVRTIYTAHGFHFYQGAPLKNWVLFYPVEKFFSRWTDVLITINREDYELARRKMHAKRIEYVPGIGVDAEGHLCADEICLRKRAELGIPEQAFLVVSAAEFTENKNQITVIRAMEQLKDKEIYFLMCGIGEKKTELEQYVVTKELSHIKFAGFRKDIHEILQTADCFVLSSIREGLSVALMEAMAERLPIVCSRIRGNVDLVEDGKEGYLVDALEADEYRTAFLTLFEKKNQDFAGFLNMGQAAHSKVQKFASWRVDELMRKIYSRVYQKGTV